MVDISKAAVRAGREAALLLEVQVMYRNDGCKQRISIKVPLSAAIAGGTVMTQKHGAVHEKRTLQRKFWASASSPVEIEATLMHLFSHFNRTSSYITTGQE